MYMSELSALSKRRRIRNMKFNWNRRSFQRSCQLWSKTSDLRRLVRPILEQNIIVII